MQDKEQKGWYKVTVALHDGLFQEINKDMSNGGQVRPQNIILIKQTFLLIQLYKDCIFVGFAYEDKEAEKIISNLMSKVSSESSLLIEIPDNPFYNLYFGLCCLERVLELIKEEYTTNINASIKHLEDIIYRNNDFQNLIEVSRNIGRKLINQDLHSDFSILKNHITEQLEYLKQSKKQALIESTPKETLSIAQKTDNVEEQIKINLDSNYESLFEHFKETYLIGLKVSTSLIDITKYYDLFDKELKILLSFAGFKSIKTKLETLREIKIKFLMSLGNAEQFIGLDRNGVYEHPKPSTFVQTEKGIEGLVQRVHELDKNMKEPLIVAKANKRVYEDIISLLDREEEMILIELKNGKSLDYSPLNDKQDNGNPTTSAPVEEGKKDKRCLFNSLQIAIAVTMVNEKTGQFPKEISKTDTEGIKKFLKDIEVEFKIENVPNRVIRAYNGLKIGKDFFQNLSFTDKEGVKKILEIKPYTELLKGIK